MNDIAQDRLHAIIKSNGLEVIKYPDRCEGLLRDHCAEYRLEVSVLVSALKERIPNELLKPVSGVPRDVQLAMLARRLEDNNGFTESVAAWAVDAWAIALDQPPSSKKKSAPQQAVVPAPVPMPLPEPVATPNPNPMGAWTGPVVALALLAALAFVGVKAWERFGPHTDQTQTQTQGNTSQDPNDGTKDNTKQGENAEKQGGNGGKPGTKQNSNQTKAGKEALHGTVTLPAGTPFNVRMNDGVSSETARVGETFLAVLDKPVTLKGQDGTVLPKGTEVTVRVTTVSKAGRAQGAAALGLRVVSVSLHDQTIPVSTATWLVKGEARGKKTGKLAGIVGAIGAGVGAVAGGVKGAIAGGLVGAGGAVAYQQVKPGDPVRVRPEAVLRFNLNEPLQLEL